jgi:uncharacterized membrane protein
MNLDSISMLLSLIMAVATSAPADATSFKITTKRDNDKVEVKSERDEASRRLQMNGIKAISEYVLAIFMITAGIMHFVNPAFFLRIMPPYLPLHQELVLVSGILEVVFGVLLLVPRTSRMAAWGIVALLIAVFPANVYLFQNQDIMPASPIIHLLRLPMQGVLILWAYWHTRPAKVNP